MSFKRVLEVARRIGAPVIVTDQAGEAAQVIMPFEDFSSLVDATSPISRKPRVTREADDKRNEIAQALTDLTFERVSEQARTAADRLEHEMGTREQGQGFLEDRFYLEPINDEEEAPR